MISSGNMEIKRGDIVLANFNPAKGSEMSKIRPCLIIQNDIGNKYSPNTIVLAITSKLPNKSYPTDVFLPKEISDLEKDSVILCSHIYTFSIEDRIIKKISEIKNINIISKINQALKTSLGII
jgi:mRNA interferase MazF